MNTQSLSAFYFEQVPQQISGALAGVVMAAHRHASSLCFSRWLDPEARDALPHVRRAFVEHGLIYLQKRFPRQVRVHLVTNAKGNSARKLVCGGISLTASYLGGSDGRVPREAVYRNNIAGDAYQMRCHPEDEAERIRALEDYDKAYAILCHAAKSDLRSGKASSVSVVFVDQNCRFIAEIDLLKHVAISRTERQVEVITDEVIAMLKTDIATGRSGGMVG